MSDEGGVMPSDVVLDIIPQEATPVAGKGALGTWQFQEYPDKVGPVNNGTSLEVNRNEQGCMWVST
jgi:hypothetical protein